MKLNNIFAICTFVLFFIGSKLTAQTVYITDSGKKYHAKNCDIVKTGKKGVTLEEAKKKGLEPCKFCKVETENKEVKSSVADKPKETAKDKAKAKK